VDTYEKFQRNIYIHNYVNKSIQINFSVYTHTHVHTSSSSLPPYSASSVSPSGLNPPSPRTIKVLHKWFAFLCLLLIPNWLSLCVLRRTCRQNRLYETLFHTVIILSKHHQHHHLERPQKLRPSPNPPPPTLRPHLQC
jgi:hypothetical protein